MVKVIERLSGSTWVPPWIYYQHINRYKWAAPFVKDKRVIDAACGTGYGARMLMEAGAQSVDGFDLSADAIEEARKQPFLEKLRFSQGNVLNLPTDAGQYDVYISFETIEHIPDDAACIKEACRILKPDGTLICSTPNRLMTNPGISLYDKPFNPFHMREYTREEFQSFLRIFFNSVVFFAQSNFATSYCKLLNAIGKRMPMLAVRTHQIRKTLGIPFCRMKNHYPQPWTDANQPEVQIAVSTQIR